MNVHFRTVYSRLHCVIQLTWVLQVPTCYQVTLVLKADMGGLVSGAFRVVHFL